MSLELHPKVDVFVSPGKVQRGQMISIQSLLYDSVSGSSLDAERLYMQIIDSKGVEIWPVSTMAEDTPRMDKLISTSEMPAGKYVVRVSPSKKFSPMGVGAFEIEEGFGVVPLIPPVLLAITSSTKSEKIRSEFVEPRYPKITWLIYQTEKDSRVCEICRPHEGKIFRADDPTLIIIAPPQLGGDTHYRCRCHYDYITRDDEIRQFNAEINEIYEVYQVYKAAQKGFNQLESLVV